MHVLCVCVVQSQAHGRIVRKLSKKLKVSSRKYPGTSGFSPLRSSSPVLYTSQTPPRCPSNHFHSGSDESDWSPANHTSSHGTYVCMHMHHNIILKSLTNYVHIMHLCIPMKKYSYHVRQPALMKITLIT